jgi:hypothetical protein
MDDEKLIKRKKVARTILVITTIFFITALLPGIWAAIKSVMLYGPGTSIKIIILFSFISTFPFISIFSLSSWIFYYYRKYGMAIFISFLPFLNIVCAGIIYLILLIFFGGNLK